MNRCSPEFLSAAADIVGAQFLELAPRALRSGSRDCFHFSPVLTPLLDDCQADAIAFPASQEELAALITLAVREQVPLTPRGGGTGNYGQGVPLHGGLMINTRRMNRIIDLDADHARVEAGVNLWTIEQRAADCGGELRMFPSTIGTSSAAGFITGGSGGIGSVNWGMLRDLDNVRGVSILTIEEQPQRVELGGQEALRDVLHNCGLTAFVTEVDFALAPRRDWQQYIFAAPDFATVVAAGAAAAADPALSKRLVSAFEWPIPSYFKPLVKREACPEGEALLFLISDQDPDTVGAWMAERGLRNTYHQPAPELPLGGKGFQIYDFTWNHTTQWAMKFDPSLTYLQEGFDMARLQEQLDLRKAKYGDSVQTHLEFVTDPESGAVRAAGLAVVRFENKDALWELMAWSEENGITIANPHTHYLDEDVRWYNPGMLTAKDRWDPQHLLNPGHLHALEQA
ncbi:FAD-binding oxidoreductase [Mangrovimicrobium sediminis]|uniref:FAD-binding oxidoreductase n=1 Tax=Mangrovimicrobium sediminis TaxID=2562682 RepID=A0A4Z0M4H9_9GAMM|nr:FAD-binding oxidoreductase [Haliea sp. SAOS-164]TGD74593.1 FAD-binding oxidoreductase [Haliea sp. SAOS-164]